MNQLLNKTKGDKVIWALVVLLALMSLLVIYSSTGSLAYKMYKGNTEIYLFKQVVFIGVGLVLIYFFHQVNYTIYSRVSKVLFWLVIPLLIYTLFFGVRLNEGSRWIKLPIINLTFQTSDLAKLVLFMYLSRMLSKKQEVIKDFKKGFLPLIIPVGLVCVFIAPANLSTALLVGATSMLLLFIGRASMKHLFYTGLIAMIPVVILVLMAVWQHKEGNGVAPKVENRNKLTARVATWVNRVESFMYGSDQKNDEDNYQVNQAKIAIAKGGWMGLGPGNSEQRNFLPHPYSDFIYAIIIEEYGIAGGAFVLFVYLVFLFRSIQLFRKCPFAFGAFLALALSFTLVIQAMTNMAVNVNLFPVTGVTLPLVSMGGSSFLFTCTAIGIILSVSRFVEKNQLEGKEEEEEEEETQDEKEEAHD
ncbi:FtsW/RodA/SpoVE family cell cycle protein [Flavihumibacter cheonanensis]|jgi:cell division protein FtsW|uniref:FtsW/RodA/SpoVE family cell cycle protein n=1 Tax=Flavihumibacter cheonanensis TaxID=1442385 RepID=UPI001EF9219E|nr:FtsW/RodA/SpoVE family cell cycle protein [Flavihumibacter cheonanensis]MCG7753556.1 FtsW/RodA/SpoVE family cell cycle protein [Flavihumibacter cheonanensis]